MSSLKKNFSYQIAYRILTVITPLITSPIVSRALGPDNLGIYSATQAFANYFMFVAMLGIEKYGQRTIAAAGTNEMKQRSFWEIYTVQFASSILAIIAYGIALRFSSSDRRIISLIQGLWVISCLLDISWFYFGREEFKVTVTRNFAIKLTTVILIAFFIRKPTDLYLYAFIMAGGTTLSQLVLWLSLPRRIKFERVNWERVRPHIVPILKLFVPVIALSVYHIMDKTMLDMLSTEAEVGYYYAVDKIVYIPLGFILAIGTVMLTRVSYVLHNETEERAKNLLSKSVEVTMFITCAVTFGIGAISKEFIPFFFGSGFEPCVELMYMFLPVLLIKALGDVVRTQYLIASGKDNIYTMAVTSGAVTNVVFNVLLIPKFGAEGAVIGTLAAEFVVLVVQVAGCRKEVPFIRYFGKQLSYVCIGIAMLICVRAIHPIISGMRTLIQLVVMVGIGAIVYMVLCFILWMLKKDSVFHMYAEKAGSILRGKNNG